MFSKFKSNYNLANVLVRIFFVLTYVFMRWQDFLGTSYILDFSAITGGAIQLSGTSKLLLALFSAALLGMVIMFLLPFVVNLFLNLVRIYSVPRAEYCLMVHLYCTIGFFVCGLLNLINLITPIFLTWGAVLFPFVVIVGCGISFYFTTSKLYFNDVTAPHYFKCLMIVLGVLLLLAVIL